jgi:ATP-dependent Lhr-like helicase
MTAYVSLARSKAANVPRWQGGRMPLSTSLSHSLRRLLAEIRHAGLTPAEREAAGHLLAVQAGVSAIPSEGELLAEICETRDGRHLFLFPFEGRAVHGGLAAILALRLSRVRPATFSLSVNDYGIELLCPDAFPFEEHLDAGLFARDDLAADARESVNLSEMARRRFREIARVAGLVFQGYPGARKTGRQVQASAGLIYDVFARHDPHNRLLDQARREILEEEFEWTRLEQTLDRLRASRLAVKLTARPSPLAFPLLVDRLGTRLSSESLQARIERMKRRWIQKTPG